MEMESIHTKTHMKYLCILIFSIVRSKGTHSFRLCLVLGGDACSVCPTSHQWWYWLLFLQLFLQFNKVEPKAYIGASGSRYTVHVWPWSTAYSQLESASCQSDQSAISTGKNSGGCCAWLKVFYLSSKTMTQKIFLSVLSVYHIYGWP